MIELNVTRASIDPRRWSAIDAMLALVRAWNRRRRFAGLRDLDDRQLRDIGLTRDDLEWGLSLPLQDDATRSVIRRRAVRGSTGAG